MYIKRNLEGKILSFLNSPEIIAIAGARQSGKTTLINQIISKVNGAVSVSFEDQNVLKMFEKNIDDFVNIYVKGNKYLFIDEFQYAKSGGKLLKYIFDAQKIKIIITGSSAIDLTIRAVKYLVGRVLIFNLYPFNFEEFLLAKDKNYFKIYKQYKEQIRGFNSARVKIGEQAHKKLLEYYEEYLLFGGYPRVVIENNYESKKELLRNIYNTYFLRDVRDILGLIDDYKLGNLINALALQTGGLIGYGELSRLSGFSYPSLKKYLNFLEKTFICRFARPFYRNKRSEIVKNPKVYFFDSGLRNSIIDDFRKLEKRTDKGALLENGLAEEFIKHDYKFNFWRDKKKNEIDFILLLGGGRTIAVESKSYLKDGNIAPVKVFNGKYPDIDIYFSYLNVCKKLVNQERIYPVYLF
ncbi:ATP-binding protein [Patescibacteria group bacterium]|nr:ATP-binding protein [Patescibacteria group bacterium]MBU4601421.1 ATP-binding protein [Patescibacteria group bacterium]MCG2698178.1 ATP-binding protein [Candidatus Parcubacteria bacterium]